MKKDTVYTGHRTYYVYITVLKNSVILCYTRTNKRFKADHSQLNLKKKNPCKYMKHTKYINTIPIELEYLNLI